DRRRLREVRERARGDERGSALDEPPELLGAALLLGLRLGRVLLGAAHGVAAERVDGAARERAAREHVTFERPTRVRAALERPTGERTTRGRIPRERVRRTRAHDGPLSSDRPSVRIAFNSSGTFTGFAKHL